MRQKQRISIEKEGSVMRCELNSRMKCKGNRERLQRRTVRKSAGWAGTAGLVVGLCAFQAACAEVKSEAGSGAWAKYKMLSTYTYGGEKPPLDTVVLRIGPEEKLDGKRYRWWQMECLKSGGGSFFIRVLSRGVPMLGQKRPLREVARYILQEGEESPVEYVNAETGKALLTLLDFRRLLVPVAASSGTEEGQFASRGRLLGQMLTLWEWSGEGEFPAAPNALVLRLDPGLLIGTGRNFRDTLDQRITGDEDYPYSRFTKEDYDEMIEAGINYFTVDPEQAEWIRRRPVFYEQRDLKGARFPEILYRSNYTGAVQFVDEPACYIYGDEDAKKGAKRPADLAELLALRVLRTLSIETGPYSSLRLEQALCDAGFNPGLMLVVEPDIPIWETLIQTSFYQLQSGAASGIIHEGRYRLDSFRASLKKIGLESEWVGEKEMLLFHYAFLRGAARAWDADWGMSIYGQADPAISPLAVTLAYDLGARYIWYWTSDHQHHLPYREQLDLTRRLRAYQKDHPRKSSKELVMAAKVAIALPYGYVMDFGPLWASNDFALDKANEAGVAYGEVVRAAAKQAMDCLKKGESFDFAVESEVLNLAGYERIIRIRADGTVETEGKR